MGAREAREVAGAPAEGEGGSEAQEEWGEKVERVWEFLKDTGGLGRGVPPRREDHDANGGDTGSGLRPVKMNGDAHEGEGGDGTEGEAEVPMEEVEGQSGAPESAATDESAATEPVAV